MAISDRQNVIWGLLGRYSTSVEEARVILKQKNGISLTELGRCRSWFSRVISVDGFTYHAKNLPMVYGVLRG